MLYQERHSLMFIILIVLLTMWVGIVSAMPTTSNDVSNATLTLIKSDDTLMVGIETGGIPISAFSFDIVYDGTSSATCTSDISILNCNPQFDETTLRVNYYSALSPLSGEVALFEMPISADMTRLCAENLKFVTADLEEVLLTNTDEQLCASEQIPLSVTLTRDRSMIRSSLTSLVVVIGLIGLLWATRYARQGRAMVMIISGLLLGGLLLYASPTSAQTTPTSTLGDLNCDSVVDIVDALLADQYMNGIKNGQNGCPAAGTTDVHTAACDTNLDGACTNEDAEILAHCDVGFGSNTFCHRVPDSYLLMPSNATVGATLTTATINEFLTLTNVVVATVQMYDAIGMFSVSDLPVELIPDILASGQYIFEFDTMVEMYQTASWGLDRIDQRNLPLNNTFISGATGVGVHAYIIDSGVRSTHSEFVGRMGNGYTVINDGFGTEDCNGHGTHVAGTVGGTNYGVATDVTIYPIRVFGCSGGSPTSIIANAVNWVTINHQSPAVVNMSLGGSGNSVMDSAVQNSIAQGLTYVVAAGNSDANACNYSPARVSNALTVGATMSNDRRPDVTNWGYNYNYNPPRPQGSNYGNCVDLFAPGDSITSAWYRNNSDTATIGGTSMAAPHVAGAAALYLEMNPLAPPSQVFSAIIGDATSNVVTNKGAGSPNKLLYIGNITAPTITPTSTPTPVAPTSTSTPTPVAPTSTPTPSAPSSAKGMTWEVISYDPILDISRIGCAGCGSYSGDTSCSIALPVLCVKLDGSSRPPYNVPTSGGALTDEYYSGWLEGQADITAPISGSSFAGLADADAYCAAQLGTGYRMAEFHDGRYVVGMSSTAYHGSTWSSTTSRGAWTFFAPGQLSTSSRLWTYIDDQNANCWDSGTSIATSTPTPVVIATATPTSIPTATQTPPPVATATATSTPVVIATATPTSIPTVTPTPISSSSAKGMTWEVTSYDSVLDISRIGCAGCGSYSGDTSCSIALPVLCVKLDGSSRPPYNVPTSSGALTDEYYSGWLEGQANITAPIAGSSFTGLADADAYCAAQLGTGYRMAEFHDGRYVVGMSSTAYYGSTWPSTTSRGAWTFFAPGQLSTSSRLWTYIDDQNANCWD